MIMIDDQKELFVVVDTDDHILEYRTRYDCHHDKTLIHRTAGVLIFDGDRFLLQKRSDKKALSLRFKKTFLVRAAQESEMSTLFFADYPGPFHIDKDEVTEVRFFTKQELQDGVSGGTIILTDCALETLKHISMIK